MEFKKSLANLEAAGKTLCGFLNQNHGGMVLIGDLLDKTFEQSIKSASDLDYEQTLPYIMRYSQWTFCDLNAIKNHYQQRGFNVEILKQPDHFQLSHYRKDLRIWR